MKQMTISFEDALYERATTLAAARGLSLDDLVQSLVRSQVGSTGETEDAYRARMEMVEMARKATGGLGGWKWNREELYAERERVSRYERPDLRSDGDE